MIVQTTPTFADSPDGMLAVTIGPETRLIDKQLIVAILEGRSADNTVLAGQIALAVRASYPTPTDFASATAADVSPLVTSIWWTQ